MTAEDVTVSAETLEGPGEVGLHGHPDGAAGRDDAQQHAGAVRALGLPAKSRFRRVERFPVAPQVWAAPLPLAIERGDAALPNFAGDAELLATLGVGLETLAAAPAPWPRIALSLAIDHLRQGEPTLDEQQRARFLTLLQTVAKRDASPEVTAAVARWTHPWRCSLRRVSPYLSSEQRLPRGVRDGHHRRVLEPALDRDGVEALAHLVHPAQQLHPVL